MKKSSKKNVNLDSLAIMIANGFSSVDKRFDKIEDRLTKVENRLTSVEDRLTKVENRLTSVEDRLGTVEDVLKATRQDVLNIGDRFVPRYEFDTLLSRVSRIEQRLQGKHSK